MYPELVVLAAPITLKSVAGAQDIRDYSRKLASITKNPILAVLEEQGIYHRESQLLPNPL